MELSWNDVWITTDATQACIARWQQRYRTPHDWLAHTAAEREVTVPELAAHIERQRRQATRAVERRFPGVPMRHLAHAELPDRWSDGVSGGYLSVLGELPQPDLAVVGTRTVEAAPSAPLGRWLRELADTLPCVWISGGAFGVDTAALHAALAAERTFVVVVAGGLAFAGPKANLDGFRAVLAAGGAVVSERAPLVPPQRSAFLRRNRVIAAAAQATLVVRSDLKGGAMSTAAHARALGRPVFATPGPPWEQASAGTNALLASGARMCTRARDIAEVVAPAQAELWTRDALPRPHDLRPVPSDPTQATIYAAIQAGAQTLERLSRAVPVPVPVLQHAVLMLTLDGRISETSDGYVVF